MARRRSDVDKWAAIQTAELRAVQADREKLLKQVEKLRAGGRLIIDAVSQAISDYPPNVTYPPAPKSLGLRGRDEVACVHVRVLENVLAAFIKDNPVLVSELTKTKTKRRADRS